MKIGLPALLHPHSVHAFKLTEPFVTHHHDQSLKQLTELPFLSSLDTLLKSWPATIQAHLPDLRDESSSIDTNNQDAKKLFANGMGLLFNNAQQTSPVLQEWLAALRNDLGLSALSYGRCLIYATPAGKGTAPHFDQNLNFVLQISGTKTWYLAPNEHLQNPLTRHTMGLPPDPEMQGYLQSELPNTMPATSQCIELEAGSLLFVPRGYWHSTHAQTEALSLNFTFTAATWIDVFTAALRSRLALSPEWRESVTGLSSPDQREVAETYLEALLASITEDLPNWQATDVLDATETQA